MNSSATSAIWAGPRTFRAEPQELALKVQGAEEKLATSTGRSPTVVELAQYMELSLEHVLEGLEAAAAHHAGSLAVPLDDGDDEARSLVDTLGVDDAGFALAEDRATVVAAMHLLSVREQHVLTLRFFEDRTQAEIAGVIGGWRSRSPGSRRWAIGKLTEHAQSDMTEARDQPPA